MTSVQRKIKEMPASGIIEPSTNDRVVLKVPVKKTVPKEFGWTISN